MARPSTNWPSVSQPLPSTATSCRYGMTVKAPPNVTSPAFRPSQKISAVSETRDRAGEQQDDRGEADRQRVGAADPAPGVRPELVEQPGAEQDEHEAGVREQGQREAGDREHRQRDVGDEVAAQPDQRAGDDRADRRLQPVEGLVEVPGEVGLHVEDGEAEHEEEARAA